MGHKVAADAPNDPHLERGDEQAVELKGEFYHGPDARTLTRCSAAGMTSRTRPLPSEITQFWRWLWEVPFLPNAPEFG